MHDKENDFNESLMSFEYLAASISRVESVVIITYHFILKGVPSNQVKKTFSDKKLYGATKEIYDDLAHS